MDGSDRGTRAARAILRYGYAIVRLTEQEQQAVASGQARVPSLMSEHSESQDEPLITSTTYDYAGFTDHGYKRSYFTGRDGCADDPALAGVYDALVGVADETFAALGVELGREWADCVGSPTLSAFDYDAADGSATSGAVSPCADHTDYTLLTVVPQSSAQAGLWVLDLQAMAKTPVEAPGTAVVFPGEALERLSGARAVAALHGVDSTPTQRISLPLLYHARRDIVLDLDGSQDTLGAVLDAMWCSRSSVVHDM